MFIPPGIEDTVKFMGRRAMRLAYPEDRLLKLIAVSAMKETKFSMGNTAIDPFSLEVRNDAPCEIVLQVNAKLADGTDTVFATVIPFEQTIAKSKSKSFLVHLPPVSGAWLQKVAEARSKSMISGADCLDAMLSVEVRVKTWFCEIQIFRDFPLRIQLTN